MKRLISVALVLVMVLGLFTACGKIVEPAGTYTDQTGTSIIEVGTYDAKAKSGTMKITNTLNPDINIEGTYTLAQNVSGESSLVTLTLSDGATMEFLYDATMDVIQDRESLIAYFGPNSTEEPTAAE